MASIISRNNRYCVVYSYVDEQGNRKQKWQTFKTLPEAKARKTEIEYNQQLGAFTIPNCTTVSELLTEYVSLYGKAKWSISAYTSNMSLIRHYIEPLLGSVKLKEITARTLEKYYQTLLKTPAVPKMTDRKNKKSSSLVTPTTIHKVHNLLRSAFNQAEKWDLIEKNPARYATIPKEESRKRDIWDAQTLFKAIDCCKDDRLKLCMNVAFACSLRIGELLALTWDCVDISEESIMAGKAYIYVNKELQRVSKSVMSTLESKDILVTFPEQGAKNKTVLVLKKPKTLTSTRKVFLPKTVAEMLVAWKMEQDATIEALGSEYTNYQLVIATPYGLPTEASRIRKAMKDLIQDNDLPPVVFHSLRHPYVKHTTKIFSLRLMNFQAQAYPDARRKTRGACQLHRGGQSKSLVRLLCNRKQFSCLPPQSKISRILYAISIRLSGYTSTRSISSSASSVVSVSASKSALDASLRLSCRACSSCFCFACANTAA